jgi:hypothetical protein
MAKLSGPGAAMAKLSEPEAGARLAEEATGRLSEPGAAGARLSAKLFDPETAGARLSEPEAGVEKLMAATKELTAEGNVAKGGGGERAGSATKDSDSEGAGGTTEPGH